MKAFLIAGEDSGDALGAALIAGLRHLAPATDLTGIAGPRMQRAGMTSLFPMHELSVMGLAEVVPKYLPLRRRLNQTIAAVLEARPDVLIGIDSPDFCLRVAKAVRAADPGIRTVHYVAPTVWAWRPGRARKMAAFIDQVLALLPFEPPYMEAEGMRCDFVGHPVVSEPQASAAEVARWRASHVPEGAGPVILALPGSRGGEVTRLAPVLGAALGRLAATHPRLVPVVAAAPSVEATVTALTAKWPVSPRIISAAEPAEKRAAFRAADVALAASGTVSLELAAAGTPMVIAYDMAWLTRQIMHRMLLTDTVTLVNLVSETRAVPEFLGRDCRPEPIAGAIRSVLADPGAQLAACATTMDRLGRGGEAPGLRAARAVLDGLGAGRP